jgi:hypothetical protein
VKLTYDHGKVQWAGELNCTNYKTARHIVEDPYNPGSIYGSCNDEGNYEHWKMIRIDVTGTYPK